MLHLDERTVLAGGTPICIGVSGGRDSVALLHSLTELGVKGSVVCHYDHSWRAESAREGEWVARLAAGYGLDVELGQAQKSTLDAGGKRSDASSFRAAGERTTESRQERPALARASPETVARQARYRFFAQVAQRRGIHHLYLAHHADDQVETFFFNLLRGAGGAGLCGMHPISEQVIDGVPLTIHRPLLGIWRVEIDAYIAEHHLDFCEDPTNAETHHTRNRIRHEILPLVEQALGRKVRQPLWRAAEIATAEDEFLASQTPLFHPGQEVSVAVVLAVPLALQRRALHAWLRGSGVPQVGFEEVESLLRLCTERVPAKVNLSAGWHARRRAGKLFLEPRVVE